MLIGVTCNSLSLVAPISWLPLGLCILTDSSSVFFYHLIPFLHRLVTFLLNIRLHMKNHKALADDTVITPRGFHSAPEGRWGTFRSTWPGEVGLWVLLGLIFLQIVFNPMQSPLGFQWYQDPSILFVPSFSLYLFILFGDSKPQLFLTQQDHPWPQLTLFAPPLLPTPFRRSGGKWGASFQTFPVSLGFGPLKSCLPCLLFCAF